MGQTITIHCDLCDSTEDVHPVVVSRRKDKEQPWEVDLCSACFEELFLDLEEAKRQPSTTSLKPPARAKRTDSGDFRL